MTCRHCGKNEHVCVRPRCGHSLDEHRFQVKNRCSNRTDPVRCNCEGYIESDEENTCRVEREKEQKWPVDVFNMLSRLKKRFHPTDPEYVELVKLIKRGEKVLLKINVSLD